MSNIFIDMEKFIWYAESIRELKKGFEKHEEKEIVETSDVAQGNLVLGLSIDEENKKEKYIAVVYNAILRRFCNIKDVPNCKGEA